MFFVLLLSLNVFSISPEKELNLKAIRIVESNDGENTEHLSINSEDVGTAIGKYGITPILIQDIVLRNKEKYNNFKHLIGNNALETGKLATKFRQLSPSKWSKFEDMLVRDYYNRIVREFGENLNIIAYAWLNGIGGTKIALKNGKDIDNHWHVKKVVEAKKQLISSR